MRHQGPDRRGVPLTKRALGEEGPSRPRPILHVVRRAAYGEARIVETHILQAILLALAFLFSPPAATLPAASLAGDERGDTTPSLPLGIDARGVKAMISAGATPAFAASWVLAETPEHGWRGLERALDEARASQIVPVIHWYYWGDSISPECVEVGCDGRSRSGWVATATTLVEKIQDHMQGATAYVVLENEFNKGGIDGDYAATFDGYLEAQAQKLKEVPGIEVVLGFGGWGEDAWSRFPRAIAASDMIGFQLMRASTRDTEIAYRNAPPRIEDLLAAAKTIAPRKDAFLYDLALSSHGGAQWATAQAETLADILARGGELAAAGLRGVVYRNAHDDATMSLSNYYGAAEKEWGLLQAAGGAKSAWDVWIRAGQGQTIASLPAAPFQATFAPRGDPWWVEVDVEANHRISEVCARVADGPCTPLERRPWGSYARGMRAPEGAEVVFVVTSTDGETTFTSAAQRWPPETDPIGRGP